MTGAGSVTTTEMAWNHTAYNCSCFAGVWDGRPRNTEGRDLEEDPVCWTNYKRTHLLLYTWHRHLHGDQGTHAREPCGQAGLWHSQLSVVICNQKPPEQAKLPQHRFGFYPPLYFAIPFRQKVTNKILTSSTVQLCYPVSPQSTARGVRRIRLQGQRCPGLKELNPHALNGRAATAHSEWASVSLQ